MIWLFVSSPFQTKNPSFQLIKLKANLFWNNHRVIDALRTKCWATKNNM